MSLFHQKSKIAHSVMECTFTFVQWSSIHTIHSVALVSPACALVVVVVQSSIDIKKKTKSAQNFKLKRFCYMLSLQLVKNLQMLPFPLAAEAVGSLV